MAALAICRAVNAAAPDSAASPYQGIVERNVFGLKPPPPPPDPEANKPPPPKIILQGFTTFGGTKRALLKAQMPPKPGEPPKGEQSFILAEGQRDGDIEVLEIDPQAGTVKVNNFGTITNLNFENNGIKTAAAAPAPVGMPSPGGFVPKPAAIPFPQAGGSQPVARPMRLPTAMGASSASPGAYGGMPAPTTYTSVPAPSGYGSAAGTLNLSGLTAGSTPNQTAAQQQQQQPPMSAEAVAALVRLQQLANKNRSFPPSPPPLTGGEENSGPPTPSPTPVPNVPQLQRAPGMPLLPPQMPQ